MIADFFWPNLVWASIPYTASRFVWKKSRPYHFKFFKLCLPQIWLAPFLNTLSLLITSFRVVARTHGNIRDEEFWAYFTPCSSVSIVNFEHVIACLLSLKIPLLLLAEIKSLRFNSITVVWRLALWSEYC